MALISIEFFALAAAAILCSILFTGRIRALLFLALNFIFLSSYLSTAGLASTLVFCAVGYLFIRLALAGKKWATPAGVIVLLFAFVFMRRYTFLNVLLPDRLLTSLFATIGLSFLLFRVLHVLIDAGGGVIQTCDGFTYANYSLNFTTFLMGPIQRFDSFADQWNGVEESRPYDFSEQLGAMNRVLRGLVKKFVLAELLSPYIYNSPATNYRSVHLAVIFLKAYSYYLYLYCDFSGYCDIVIGIGTLMGLRPPENFNMPFIARNVADYWLRFHRSLTQWLTEYVFTPMYSWGLRRWSSRSAAFPIMLASLMITMILSGLWHGTTSAFLIFGIMHGVYMVIFRLYERGLKAALTSKGAAAFNRNPAVVAAGIFVTFNAVAVASLCFILTTKQLGQVAHRLMGNL